jgi:cytosine/adenosine deaminase-related metal-dependent hydrolase
MAYRKFKPDELFDGTRIHTDKVLVTDNTGKIEALLSVQDSGEGTEQLEGLLAPGLINAHCHLELSHLKNIIPPHTGLIEFLCSVVTKRNFSEEVIQKAIAEAEAEMYENGIVAVGDIGNTADTAAVKSKSQIRWYNFVEVLSFTDEQASLQFEHYRRVAETMEEQLRMSLLPHRTSLVPHAPYSISPLSFKRINEATAGRIISMHNQEHPAENELYETGGGEYLRLFEIFGMKKSPFPVTGESSIRSVLPFFNLGQTIFLIHNTFMTEAEVQWANAWARTNGLKLVYGLCPNANLYIENRLPPAAMFLRNDCLTVLGTDSYSSNWQLSIAAEMNLLLNKAGIPREVLLRMATLNGAKAFGWESELGSFEKGKKPGLVLMAPDFSWSKRLMDAG